MILYPAIDIMDGQAVRLVEGRFEDATRYHDDPVEAARQLQGDGFLFGQQTLDPETHVLETAGELTEELAAFGGALMVEALARLDALVPQAQTEEGVNYAAKIDKAETRLDFARPAPFAPAGEGFMEVSVPETSFHWRLRAIDAAGEASAWAPFGGNAESDADFMGRPAGSDGADSRCAAAAPASGWWPLLGIFFRRGGIQRRVR